MIKTILDYDALYLEKYEPSLKSLRETEQIDYNDRIKAAKDIFLADIKNRGKEIKKINIPIEFCNGEITAGELITNYYPDKTERTRFVVELSSTIGDNSFTLIGKNGKSEKIVANIAVSVIGTYINEIEQIMEEYKLKYIGDGCNAKVYLIERCFDFVHLYKTLEIIFMSFASRNNSNWMEKSNYYGARYSEEMSNIIYSYDFNGDYIISAGEVVNNKSGIFVR